MLKNSQHITFKQARKFIFLLSLLICYTVYLSIEYDFKTGGLASLLTWSFFVLCTPVADAGGLLDFPLRLLFGIRMIISEIFVWMIAIVINTVFIFFFKEYYETTLITKIFYQILTTPYPYWIIILLSGLGTFLSIFFGDKVLDLISKKQFKIFFTNKKHFYYSMFLILIFIATIIAYYNLIKLMNINY